MPNRSTVLLKLEDSKYPVKFLFKEAEIAEGETEDYREACEADDDKANDFDAACDAYWSEGYAAGIRYAVQKMTGIVNESLRVEA